MSAGPGQLRQPVGRIRSGNATNYNNSNNMFPPHRHKSTTSTKLHISGGAQDLYITPGLHNNAENRVPHRHRNAEPSIKRQTAIDCGLKSLPVNTRWTPAGRSNYSENRDPVKMSQSQLVLQAPEGSATSRRGLSGSKVRKSSSASRSGSQTPRGSFVTDHSQEQWDGAGLLTASPRPPSLKFNTRFSQNGTSEDDEDCGPVSSYKWNTSDQGLRLQRELSKLNSSRSMKRASEMVSHRIDPMYLMSGSKISLQNRYGIDDDEMKKLHEMTQVREGLMSDLKKMKFPYGARAPTYIVKTMKPQPDINDTLRETNTNSKGQVGHLHNANHFPSTSASDLANDEHVQEVERPPSEHTDTDNSLTGPD